MGPPRVSVVVPTHNAGPSFGKLLGKLMAQEGEFDREILVLDSGSTDGTVGTAQRYGAAVHHIPRGEFDHGATRDLGVSLSGGDYVALIVQDAMPLDGRWLAAMVEVLEQDARTAGVYSRQLPRPKSKPITRVLVNSRATASPVRREQSVGHEGDCTKLTPEDLRRLAGFDNVSSCLRRSVWERMPFGRTGFGEDLRWAKKAVEAGYRVVYEPRSAVFHSHERGAAYDLRRHYVDQQVLLDLFGLELVPGLGKLLLGTLRSTAYLYLRMLRDEKASVLRSVPPTIVHAASSQVGAYLGAKAYRLAGSNPRLAAGLDRLFSRGI